MHLAREALTVCFDDESVATARCVFVWRGWKEGSLTCSFLCPSVIVLVFPRVWLQTTPCGVYVPRAC